MERSDTFDFLRNSTKKANKERKFISCAKINKYFFIPFLSPVFIFIRDVLLDHAHKKTKGLRKILQYELYDGIMHSGCILLYVITYIRTGKERKIQNIYLKQLSNKKTEHNKIKIILIILTIGFSLNNYISSKMLFESYTVFEMRIYHVIFNAIFCRFILGYKVYKHQLLSILLILVGWILISIPIYHNFTANDIIVNLQFMVFGIFYPLYLALVKYIIENYYVSVYLYMFFIGVTLIIISIILNIINSLFIYSNCFDFINVFDFASNKLLLFFAIVSGTIVKFILCITLQNFSPNIFILTNIISTLMSWIYKLAYKRKIDETLNIICLSIGYFIIFISCLIYNEIIILNFCGLGDNTNTNINKRLLIDNRLSEFDEEEINNEDIGDDYTISHQDDDNDNDNDDDNDDRRISISSLISIDPRQSIEMQQL